MNWTSARSLLRDYINATVGFEDLADATHKSPKSLMRMLSAEGNPQAPTISSQSSRICRRTRALSSACKLDPDREYRRADERAPIQPPRIHRLRALLRAEADGGGEFRARARARRDFRLQGRRRLRPLLFHAEGCRRRHRRGDLAARVPAAALQAAGGAGDGGDRQAHHLPEPLALPDHRRASRAGRRRRADGAARGAAEEARGRRPVRRRRARSRSPICRASSAS